MMVRTCVSAWYMRGAMPVAWTKSGHLPPLASRQGTVAVAVSVLRTPGVLGPRAGWLAGSLAACLAQAMCLIPSRSASLSRFLACRYVGWSIILSLRGGKGGRNGWQERAAGEDGRKGRQERAAGGEQEFE